MLKIKIFYEVIFAIMIVITANKVPKITVTLAKSASIPLALPEKTASLEPSIPPKPPDFGSCPKTAAINASATIASITIKTVNKINSPPIFLKKLLSLNRHA